MSTTSNQSDQRQQDQVINASFLASIFMRHGMNPITDMNTRKLLLDIMDYIDLRDNCVSIKRQKVRFRYIAASTIAIKQSEISTAMLDLTISNCAVPKNQFTEEFNKYYNKLQTSLIYIPEEIANHFPKTIL